MRRPRTPPVVEDSYEPAPLDVAWREYVESHPGSTSPETFYAFRAGYRRGFGQGALVDATTFVHTHQEQ